MIGSESVPQQVAEPRVPLAPEDLILKRTDPPKRRLPKPPKKKLPPWTRDALTALAIAGMILGMLILFWRLQPEDPFNPPPDSVKVVGVKPAQREGIPVLQGYVSNKSGRLARKLTFLVEYRSDGQNRSTFLTLQDVPDQALVEFAVPLIQSHPGDVSVIQPGSSSSLEGPPRFIPYDSQWEGRESS
jgi:hypothetical protein